MKSTDDLGAVVSAHSAPSGHNESRRADRHHQLGVDCRDPTPARPDGTRIQHSAAAADEGVSGQSLVVHTPLCVCSIEAEEMTVMTSRDQLAAEFHRLPLCASEGESGKEEQNTASHADRALGGWGG